MRNLAIAVESPPLSEVRMKIRAINHKKYFADYIKVNWKLPFQELSNYNRQKLIKWYCDIIPFLRDNLH